MAETWYARTGTGAPFGPGTRRPLNQTAGAAASTQALGTGDTWNRVETARSIAAGDWRVLFDCTVGGGGGPQNSVVIAVRIYDSGGLKTTLISTVVNVAKNTTAEYATALIPLGQVDFVADDVLAVEFSAGDGNQTKTVRFNGTAGGDADTRLLHPDEAAAVPPSGTGSIAGGGTLAGIGFALLAATALLAGGGALSGTGQAVHVGTGSLSGGGTLAGIGGVPGAPVPEGVGSIAGGGVLLAVGATIHFGTGTVPGGGNLSGVGGGQQQEVYRKMTSLHCLMISTEVKG